ncbi:MAG: hypothetical protein ACI9P8_001574, partial [Bacteroidia bacterium]
GDSVTANGLVGCSQFYTSSHSIKKPQPLS